MKLIDILNMISKRELKKGTKLVWYGDKYTYNGDDEFYDEENDEDLWECLGLCSLNKEVELIEPDHFTDARKMAEKIEELDVKCLSDIFIANDAFNKMVAFSTTLHKLNEVINKVNAQTTVLLTQNDKDYDEAVKILKNN